MNRIVILDVETTGLSTSKGDRIIELALLEMIDYKFTDNKLVLRFNPKIDIPEKISEIHGIYTADVADMPFFEDEALRITEFIKDSTIVAHNAKFDMRFLNFEVGYDLLNKVVCTMELAKSKLAIAKYNLDALCDHFSIDRSGRQLHAAELDAFLCGVVYQKLLGVAI